MTDMTGTTAAAPSMPQIVAVLGAGLIGVSWATLFAAHGLTVRIWDPRNIGDELRDRITQFALVAA